MKYVNLLLFAMVGTVMASPADLENQCHQACDSYLHPKEKVLQEELGVVVQGACKKSRKHSIANSRLCQSYFMKTAQLGCTTACTELISGNTLKANYKVAAVNKECRVTNGRHVTPNFKVACQEGYEGGILAAVEGLKFRARIEEVCADNQITEPEIKKAEPVVEEKPVETKKAEPVVEKKPIETKKVEPVVEKKLAEPIKEQVKESIEEAFEDAKAAVDADAATQSEAVESKPDVSTDVEIDEIQFKPRKLRKVKVEE